MSPEQKKAYELLDYNNVLKEELESVISFPFDLTSHQQPATPMTATGVHIMQQNAAALRPRGYEFVDYIKVPDPHPWTSDLRALAQMLEGGIELPHQGNEVHFKDGSHLTYIEIDPNEVYKDFIEKGIVTKIIPVITCPTCSAAHNLRCEYILSKESK